jgi:hypothetical protein
MSNKLSDEVMEEIVDLAARTSAMIMSGDVGDVSEAFTELLTSCGVVWAVWRDAKDENRYHARCVKGVPKGYQDTGAIMVDNEETAEAVRRSVTLRCPLHPMTGTPDRPN